MVRRSGRLNLAQLHYAGRVTWGKTRQVRRYGKRATERSPESARERIDESLRIVPEKLWQEVQRVNQKANEACWRNAQGRLLSRPTSSKYLLAPFLACGLCGTSMGCRPDRRGVLHYRCNKHHLAGDAGCRNRRGLRAEWAEKFVVDAFEEALASQVVLAVLQEAVEERRRSKVDSAPLRAELKKLQAEVKQLAQAIAKGIDIEEVRQEIAERKAKIEHLQGTLSGADAVDRFDLRGDFRERLAPVLADWRAHLRKNPSTAQQVLLKIVPTKLRAVPEPDGSWTIKGPTDYSAVVKEIGYAAVLDALAAASVVDVAGDGLRRAKHEVKHPARECRPEYACWPGHGPEAQNYKDSGGAKVNQTPGR